MRVENYITAISSYFGLGSYPFKSNQKDTTTIQTEQILELHRKIISDLEEILKLQFVQQLEKGNVCFAQHNSELQDDFKQIFTQKNILDYFYAKINSSDFQETELKKYYPKTTTEFWNQVRVGEKLRNINFEQKKCES